MNIAKETKMFGFYRKRNKNKRLEINGTLYEMRSHDKTGIFAELLLKLDNGGAE